MSRRRGREAMVFGGALVAIVGMIVFAAADAAAGGKPGVSRPALVCVRPPAAD